MAGVQNLKALFEKPNDSASPDRGRSGAISAAGLETPTRPLSKVRTNFVSVERTGHRSVSLESSRNIRSLSINESEKPNGLAIHKNDKKALVGEPTLSTTPSIGLKKASHIINNEVKESDIKKAKETSVVLTSKDSTSKIKAFEADRLSKSEASPLSIKKNTPPTSIKCTQKSPATPSRPRNNDKKVIDTKSSKKSTLSKTDSNSLNRSQIGNHPPSGKKQGQEASQPVRVKKHTPKSPTRPVKLPASLMTHTASSSSKTSRTSPSIPSRQTLRRVSSNFQQPTSSQRRMSIASNISSMPKAHIKKKPSNIHLSELGKKHLVPSAVPESATTKLSFLARMTRPTASTSSKTIEKPTTISKKSSSTRPTTNNAVKNISSKQETQKIPSIVKKERKYDVPATKNTDEIISDVSKKSITKSTSELIKAEDDEALDKNLPKLDDEERAEFTKITNAFEENLVTENESRETEILDVQNEKTELDNSTNINEINLSSVKTKQEDSSTNESEPEIKIQQLNTEEPNIADKISFDTDTKQEQLTNSQIISDVESKELSSFKSGTNGVSESLQNLTQFGSLDALNRIVPIPLPSPSHFESYGSDAFPSPISIKCGSFEGS